MCETKTDVGSHRKSRYFYHSRVLFGGFLQSKKKIILASVHSSLFILRLTCCLNCFSQTPFSNTNKPPNEVWFPAKVDKLTCHSQILYSLWPMTKDNVLQQFGETSGAAWWLICTTVLLLVWELDS